MPQSKSAEWQRIYQEALNETDQGKVIAKICAAESALLLRLQEMPYGPTRREEAMAIYDAVHALRLLRCNLYSRTREDELARMWKRTA
jgi:hypothetical protein